MEKESTYKEIIKLNRDRIYRICCGYVHNADERNDVFQEILINIWKSLDNFRGQAAVSTWIYRITVNTCLSYLRTEQRRNRHIDRDASETIDLLTEDNNEESEEQKHLLDRLYRRIITLSPIDRAVISLYLEDVSTKESAEILGISEANVRVKLHRIRKALKEMEDDYEN
ncbi:MAG TPA: RNA polymerase subunit sigma-24 [Bacteroidetes bacterium]|nr:RNA polymerase subunit sigma-24 [Bacteroidota bacterium]